MLESLLNYVILGISAGLVSGLFGLGGGTIYVPGFDTLFTKTGIAPDLVMPMAIATSLALIFLTSQFTLLVHTYKGNVRWHLTKAYIPGVALGGVAGAFFVTIVNGNIIRALFALYLIFIAVKLWVKPVGAAKDRAPVPLNQFLVSLGVGLSSGILGIGSTVFILPYLVNRGTSVRDAVVVATALSLTCAMIAMICFILLSPANSGFTGGYIHWNVVLMLLPLAIIGSYTGISLSKRISPEKIVKLFAILLVLISGKMLWRCLMFS